MSDATASNIPIDLWKPGVLYHKFKRFPQRGDVKQVDRLELILKHGLRSQKRCGGMGYSDLRMEVCGTALDYHDMVFLHRYERGGEMLSNLYCGQAPGDIIVLLDVQLPVIAPAEIEGFWPILCSDEVYVIGTIPHLWFRGVVLHPGDAPIIVEQFSTRLRELSLPVYVTDGTPYWQP